MPARGVFVVILADHILMLLAVLCLCLAKLTTGKRQNPRFQSFASTL
jgi:hypothetical protein